MLIPLLIISMCAVLVFCVDDSTISLVHDNLVNYQYVYVMLMIYSWINLLRNLLIFSSEAGGRRSSNGSLSTPLVNAGIGRRPTKHQHTPMTRMHHASHQHRDRQIGRQEIEV